MKQIYDLLQNNEYKLSKEEFMFDIIDDFNEEDKQVFSYVIINASERLRMSKMRNILSGIIDEFYFHHQSLDIEELFQNPELLLTVLKFKSEYINLFIKLLARRDREESELIKNYEKAYEEYEERLRNAINGTDSLILELESEKILTLNS